MANEEIKNKLDEFHYHEVLDRLSMIMDMIDRHILQHPAVKIESSIKLLAEDGLNELFKAYQEVASITLNRFKDE